MARPRTPTNVLDMRGAFKKHPERKAERKNEPVCVEKLGQPPDYFDESQCAAWTEIERITVYGVLTQSDRLVVEITARLLAEFRAGEPMETARLSRLESLLGKLGLSPADRSKVHAQPKPTRNPFDSLDEPNRFAKIGRHRNPALTKGQAS